MSKFTGLIVSCCLIIFCSAQAQNAQLLYQKNGQAAGDSIGYSVAIVGDMNGDARADFIVGAPYADPSGLIDAGKVYVYSGADGSLLYEKNGEVASDHFGFSVAGAGDVNGDGREDFIIGAPTYTAFVAALGSAYVYSGRDGSLLYKKVGESLNNHYGFSVAGAGDVNGDGRADFIVGTPFTDGLVNIFESGSVYVYSGLDGSLIYQKDGSNSESLGASVAGLGDINGDGLGDFIAGAHQASSLAGRAYVYSGFDGSVLYQKNGFASNDLFGYSVTGAGDVNGDGRPDFMISARSAEPNGLLDAGSVYVYSGIDGALLFQKNGAKAGDVFGSSISGGGDVNTDGRADFIIGAVGNDPNNITSAGSAYVYSGLDGSLIFQRDGSSTDGQFGFSVSGGKDMNGDSRPEIIISAPFDDSNSLNDAGSAFIYGFVANPPPSPPRNLQATAGTRSVTLSWDANTEPDFLRYRIYGGAAGASLIDSLEGGSNTSKIITNLAGGVTYYFYLIAVDQALQESVASDAASATPFADVTAPQIDTPSYNEPVTLNNGIPVSVTVSDPSGVSNVTLFYRVAGDATFSGSPMSMAIDNFYTQNIPAAFVTNRGLEFYIQADDAFGNVVSSRRYPVRVICPNGIANPQAQPNGTRAGDYRIFSIPLDLDDKTPAAFLNANMALGAPDNKKYRWYAFDRSSRTLREYPDFGNVHMTPDMGFPLLANIANLKLGTGRGTTVNTTVPYNISLPQGWSLIGNPFNFNIPFDSLGVSNGTFELWNFAGDWQINTAGLEGWTGYAVFLNQAATFSIRAGAAGLNNANSFYSTENNNAANWMIQITAENSRSVSRFNFVGQHELASDEEDVLDLHQPLRIADQVEVVFNRKNGDVAEELKADIRQPSANGHFWEFSCLLDPDNEMLSLAFDGIRSLPDGVEAFLIDEDTKTIYDLRSNQRLEFATRRLAKKHFKLIIGVKSFVESQAPETELHPKDYVLLQNFPNPFNPATQIIYSLPRNSRVELSVYNIRGEKVAMLVNENQEAGSHTIVWNAAGAGSGIYFIKLEAGGLRLMKKCLLVK